MKIEHKSSRNSFQLTVKTNDATIETDLTEYELKTRSYHIPEKTIDTLVELTMDAFDFNNYSGKEFSNKFLGNLNRNQMYEALAYLCETLGEKLVEE